MGEKTVEADAQIGRCIAGLPGDRTSTLARLRDLRVMVAELQAEMADARLALGVHAGIYPSCGLTDDEKAAITRALAACRPPNMAAKAKGETDGH